MPPFYFNDHFYSVKVAVVELNKCFLLFEEYLHISSKESVILLKKVLPSEAALAR